MATVAGLLLIAFGGVTDRLIPLFAIGAFLTFTLSQAGMVVHWRRAMREEEAGHQRYKRRVSLAINAIGAGTTGIALAIIVVAKFTKGAWITILVIPCVIVLLKAIRRYYDELTFRLREDCRLDLHRSKPPIVLVATEAWNRLTDKALDFALSFSPDVIAVHLTKLQGPDADQEAESLRCKWSRDVQQPAQNVGLRPPRLMLLQAPYRRIHVPLLQFVEQLQEEHPSRTIAVLIPEIGKRRWWENLLHTHRARRLRSALLRYGGSRLVVINAPWYLEEPKIKEALLPQKALSQAAETSRP